MGLTFIAETSLAKRTSPKFELEDLVVLRKTFRLVVSKQEQAAARGTVRFPGRICEKPMTGPKGKIFRPISAVNDRKRDT